MNFIWSKLSRKGDFSRARQLCFANQWQKPQLLWTSNLTSRVWNELKGVDRINEHYGPFTLAIFAAIIAAIFAAISSAILRRENYWRFRGD